MTAQSTPAGRILLVSFGLLLVACTAWTILRLHSAAALQEELAFLAATARSMESRLGAFQRMNSAAAHPDTAHLHGATQAIAAAELQQNITGVIRTSGGQLVESALDPGVAGASDETAIYLRVAFTGTHTALQRTIFALESGQPWVVMRSLTVSPSALDAEDPELRATILVGAEWRKPK